MTNTDWETYAAIYRQIDKSSELPPLLAAVISGRKGTLIDVGCGEGSLLNAAKARFGDFWELTGFEGIGGPIGNGPQQWSSRADASQYDAGEFDVAVSMHVIEHVEDDNAHAAELGRLVKPGGHVYVETPVKLPGGI